MVWGFQKFTLITLIHSIFQNAKAWDVNAKAIFWVKERVGPLASSSFLRACGMDFVQVGVIGGEGEGDTSVDRPTAI